ncbi:RHS repeat-associated core domain-containing protein [Parvularcula oceani]|uniref:RHS repeat-associated core domain-containing protein n=1 Tax=Parvularcula oceani TaxID=1247963 RepID=UPI0004E14BDB|nr:RHS repeat-associated core domain-containing protein [Parvularcula oceani]
MSHCGTELWCDKARAYVPRLGRFLQPVPIGFGDGLNVYAYVGGGAESLTNPSGMKTWDCSEPGGEMKVCGVKDKRSWTRAELMLLLERFGQQELQKTSQPFIGDGFNAPEEDLPLTDGATERNAIGQFFVGVTVRRESRFMSAEAGQQQSRVGLLLRQQSRHLLEQPRQR